MIKKKSSSKKLKHSTFNTYSCNFDRFKRWCLKNGSPNYFKCPMNKVAIFISHMAETSPKSVLVMLSAIGYFFRKNGVSFDIKYNKFQKAKDMCKFACNESKKIFPMNEA